MPKAVAIPPADFIPVNPTPTLWYRAMRRATWLAVRALFRVRVTGRENLPRGKYVAVANHQSWMDGWLLQTSLPAKPRPHFMGDPSNLMRNRVLWWTVRKVGGLICVDRTKHGDPVLRRVMVDCLDCGAVLALFPEGRYVRLPGESEHELLPLKKGFAHAAVGGDAPVVPIVINGARNLWFRKRIDISIGAPVETRGLDVGTVVALTRASMVARYVPDAPSHGNHFLEKRLTIRRAPSAGTLATVENHIEAA